jgi:3D (Asp-Asp-Asp) domain-containing protein
LGLFIALDTGGMIKGARIDVLFDEKQDALNWGKQIKKVRIIK